MSETEVVQSLEKFKELFTQLGEKLQKFKKANEVLFNERTALQEEKETLLKEKQDLEAKVIDLTNQLTNEKTSCLTSSEKFDAEIKRLTEEAQALLSGDSLEGLPL